ncbi:hypothetical protein AGMMS49957_13500 [Synergistales bacterium]|nr:hypothetical protein AGMMS49957_13500 [Synergistales bacterium]
MIRAGTAGVILNGVKGVKAISVAAGISGFTLQGENEIGTLIVPAAADPAVSLTLTAVTGAKLKLDGVDFTALVNSSTIVATDVSTTTKTKNALQIDIDDAIALGDSDLGTLMAAVLDSASAHFTSLAFNVTGAITNEKTLTIGDGVTLTHSAALSNTTNKSKITVVAGGTITSNGAISNGTDGTITNAGTINNNAGISNADYAKIINAASGKINNKGSLTNADRSSTITNDGTIINGSGGSIVNTAKGTFTNAGTIIDDGGDFIGMPDHRTIKAEAGTGGKITPAGDIVVFDGSTQTFTIEPIQNYSIDDVIVDDVSKGAIPTYPYTFPADAKVGAKGTIQATFKYGTAFVPVTNITGTPDSAVVGTPLTLTGTVAPSNATNQDISWTVADAGTTGATIAGKVLTTTATGTVKLTATIANGLTASTPYTKDVTITVTTSGGGDGKKGSSSGGGCNAGFGAGSGAATLLLIAASLFLKKRG